MIKFNLDGINLLNMIIMGSQKLQENKATINGLNVFPVPDGDTGTNMHLTLQSGIVEMKARSSEHLGLSAEALSRGLLMGARGNSGVILSQLFRGFAKSVKGLEQANVEQLTEALHQGVLTAYQAVVKPVEGTILTVAKEAAKQGAEANGSSDNIVQLFTSVLNAAKKALEYTPEQLPILKQVGVVDAGGQGLVSIYEGFVQALSGDVQVNQADTDIPSELEQSKIQQLHLTSEDIEYGYCTEFIIKLNADYLEKFSELQLRDELSKLGDSLVVVADDDLVKVHIHAEQPGSVMNHAMQFGDLTRIKIENMREQHAHIIHEDNTIEKNKSFGMVAVAMGKGMSSVFTSLGVDIVLEGGQSMNPSTEDILLAVNRVPADVVYIFPNNSNIILAAKQSGQLANKKVVIIPTTTIPQGIAAILAFNESDIEANESAMLAALGQVRSGSITFATRNSTINELEIRENDYIGMLDNQLVVANPNPQQAIEELLTRMMIRGDEVITLFSGEEVNSEWTEAIQRFVEQQYPDAELEIHDGGQPLYYYIIAVE